MSRMEEEESSTLPKKSRQQRHQCSVILLFLSCLSNSNPTVGYTLPSKFVPKLRSRTVLLHPKMHQFSSHNRRQVMPNPTTRLRSLVLYNSQTDEGNSNDANSSSSSPLENLVESVIVNNNATTVTTASEATPALPTTTQPVSVATSAASSMGVVPSYRRLIVFTATTILIWLSEPLLSLVDTTIVGLTSSPQNSVLQIAALGPATTLYDSAIYMTYFLAIATTNQLAPALAKKDYQRLRQSTSHLMGLALLFGSLVSAVTFGWGHSIISNMVGGAFATSTTTEAQLIPLATNYAKIRAAVAPLCVVDFVAQSFCLTILDTFTPAMAVGVASLVNLVGDLWLSPRWGIQGAAVATAMATTTSCMILVTKVRQVLGEWKRKQQVQETKRAFLSGETVEEEEPPLETGAEAMAAKAVGDVACNGSRNVEDVPFFSLPNKSAMIDLMKLAGPIFFVMMGKIACYSVLTVRATSFGVLPLATHNIMMRVFFFFACFGDSLSQAAQSFYPQVAKNKRGELIKRLFYLSLAVGLCNNQMSQLILKQLGKFLTKDASIIQMMSQYSSLVGLAVLLHPFIMLFEGTVLAKRDLVFMVGMYILTGILHFGHVFSPVASSFMGLWRALFVFQFIRLLQFAVRVWDVSRKEKASDKAVVVTGATAQI